MNYLKNMFKTGNYKIIQLTYNSNPKESYKRALGWLNQEVKSIYKMKINLLKNLKKNLLKFQKKIMIYFIKNIRK